MRKIVVLAAAVFIFAGYVAYAQQVSIGPTIPQGANASVNPSNQVIVSWSPSTETSTIVTGYYLYRNGGLIANAADATYVDNAPAGVYSYTVSAYDVNGQASSQSTPSAQVSVQIDNSAPTAPTGLAGIVSSSSITLSWNQSADNYGVAGYYITRNTVRIATAQPISGTTYADNGLVAGASYTYSVVAYDAAGNISLSTPSITLKTILDITPPSVPQGIVATPVSSSQINLSWMPSTDNMQVVGYNIYRDNSWLTMVGTTTSYSDGALSAATPYFYSVSAIDEVGNTSVQGTQANATTPPADIQPPSIPQNFAAVPISSSQVTLSWSPSKDNVGVAGYNIFNNGNPIGVTTSTTYTDSSLATSTTYEYSITAFDAANNVSPQASVAVKTLAFTPAVIMPTVPAPVAPPAPIATTPSPTPGNYVFTTTLHYGFRGSAVLALQALLVREGDLGAVYATGFYGLLTQKGVQKFQCEQSLICSGSPATTGWGSTGPRTRKVLNAL